MELVALLPLLALLLAVLWQAVVAGQAIWLTGAAARAAARAEALGRDPRTAAAAVLPATLGRRLTVRTRAGGVIARVRIPLVLAGGGPDLATIEASGRFPSQAR